MRNSYLFLWYSIIFLLVIVLDRITKCYALITCVDPIRFNRFFSCDLVFNRGISWGMFHSHNDLVFWTLTFSIFVLMVIVSLYAFRRWIENYYVFGEVLVLAGSSSNMLDRFFYGGVIDFLVFSLGSWSWPAFNLADFFIVIGISIMLIGNYRNS